jgi:MFS family permease
MPRIAGAVIAGYVVMALLIFATFTAAFLLMGSEVSFQPGSYQPSITWIAVSTLLGIVAALAGGWVCAAIGRRPTAVMALAALVFVLGIALAAVAAMRTEDPRPTVREGAVSNLQAMQNARVPLWIEFLNPVIGAVGALAGGRLKGTSA